MAVKEHPQEILEEVMNIAGMPREQQRYYWLRMGTALMLSDVETMKLMQDTRGVKEILANENS